MQALGLTRLLGFYGALLSVALLALWKTGHLSSVLPIGMPWSVTVRDIGLGLAAGVALMLISRGLARWWRFAKALETELRTLVGGMTTSRALLVALVSSLGEEALFRGVLLPAMGLMLSSAIFGLLHVGSQGRFWVWSLLAFGAGALFGGLTLMTGTLLAAIVAHATVNFLNLRRLGSEELCVVVELGPVGSERVVERQQESPR